ncbi:MAG TPA: hypothetical protein VHY91_01075 [Pirellulales bacterium]|jgi:hypothetical protein|nr:hypothetical protein [Pirellulales bacterium]
MAQGLVPAHEPLCHAMVLCDGAHRDPSTGKFTLLGTFHGYGCAAFPAPIQGVVYFAITECIGHHEMQLRIIDSDAAVADGGQADPIFTLGIPIDCDDPLATVEGVLGFAAVVPHAAAYDLILSLDGEFLSARRLVVVGPPPEAGPE